MTDFNTIFQRDDAYPARQIEARNDRDDAPDMTLAPEQPQDDTLAGVRIGIDYCDAVGTRTRRIIRLLHVTGTPPHNFLGAYCELRKAYRTFLASSVEAYFDPATGTLLDFNHVMNPVSHSPEPAPANAEPHDAGQSFRATWEIINLLRHELSLLVIVARADRKFGEPEIAALMKYAEERARDRGLNFDSAEQQVLKEWISLLDPTPDDLVRSVQELGRNDEALATIWEVSELVGEADGKITRKEKEAVRQIRLAIESHIRQMASQPQG